MVASVWQLLFVLLFDCFLPLLSASFVLYISVTAGVREGVELSNCGIPRQQIPTQIYRRSEEVEDEWQSC